MINSLQQELAEIFENNNSVCLWFSGGNDSRLLLEVMLEMGLSFDILIFEEGWSKEQKQYVDNIILKHNLTTYSYHPFHAEMLKHTENGEITDISFRFYYQISPLASVSLIKDTVKANTCAFDVKFAYSNDFVLRFDTHITGLRKFDTHYAVGQLISDKQWAEKDVLFYAPLFNWSKQEVEKELTKRKIEVIEKEELDTGNIAVCVECFKGKEVFCPKKQTVIPPVIWI